MKNQPPLADPSSDKSVGEISDIPSFVREHTNWMLAVALRILQDQGHAEDAVQVAFQKIFRNIEKFEGRSALKSWMHRIVTNEALLVLRKIKRFNEEPIDKLLPNFDSAGCRVDIDLRETATPETLLARSETHRSIRVAINTLPQDYRIVLCLRDIEGYSVKETADMLQITEANTKIRLHRARAALKKILEPVLKGETT